MKRAGATRPKRKGRVDVPSLQERLRRLSDLATQKRRPLVIEFAGTPKAGKTSSLNALAFFLKRGGFNVRVFQERASVAPISGKGTPAFNAWVTCATLLGMLEALEDQKLDVLILDRGLFDGLVWNDWQEATHRITPEEAEAFRRFLLKARWWRLIDILFVMHCDARVALRREFADQITLQPGSIMNVSTLRQLRENVLVALGRYKGQLRKVLRVDTSNLKAREGVMQVAIQTLKALEAFLDEEVLCVPKTEYEKLEVADGMMCRPTSWKAFKEVINHRGAYIRRSKAEISDRWVQIVPVAVLRSGTRFLTNIRHEPDESLHGTLAVWAGGHVRREDLSGADSRWGSTVAGLRREINEELLLAEIPEPRPIGLVHTSEDDRAARHLGVVFQVEMPGGEIVEALHNKTIAERPEKRVRTQWMNVEELSHARDQQREWSAAICDYLAQQGGR